MAEMKEEIPFKVLFTGQHTDLLSKIEEQVDQDMELKNLNSYEKKKTRKKKYIARSCL